MIIIKMFYSEHNGNFFTIGEGEHVDNRASACVA